MQRLFLGAFLAAVVLFFWGFVFWALPTSGFMLKPVPSSDALAERLGTDLPATGVYYLPEMGEGDAALARHRAGPIATVFFRREGAEPMSAGVFVFGFLHMLASTLLVGALLRLAGPSLPTYGRRVAFVALAGLAAAVWSQLGQPIWFFHPWTYHVGTAFYDVVAWSLAGLVLARFVVPARRSTALA